MTKLVLFCFVFVFLLLFYFALFFFVLLKTHYSTDMSLLSSCVTFVAAQHDYNILLSLRVWSQPAILLPALVPFFILGVDSTRFYMFAFH